MLNEEGLLYYRYPRNFSTITGSIFSLGSLKTSYTLRERYHGSSFSILRKQLTLKSIRIFMVFSQSGLTHKNNLEINSLPELLQKYALGERSFEKLNFSDENFSWLNLKRINFSQAKLSLAIFEGANLAEASLHRADLSNAELTAADLSGTDLREANLTGADLRGADLSGADLTGANLTGANLTNATKPEVTINISKAHLAMENKQRSLASLLFAPLSENHSIPCSN